MRSTATSLLLRSRPALTQSALRVARSFSTNGGGDGEVRHGSAASERPPLISTEMLEEASRNINMDEVYAEALSMEAGGDSRAPTLEDMYDLESTLEEFQGDDSTSLGHHMLRNRREILEYFRLIELELPSLQGMLQ